MPCEQVAVCPVLQTAGPGLSSSCVVVCGPRRTQRLGHVSASPSLSASCSTSPQLLVAPMWSLCYPVSIVQPGRRGLACPRIQHHMLQQEPGTPVDRLTSPNLGKVAREVAVVSSARLNPRLCGFVSLGPDGPCPPRGPPAPQPVRVLCRLGWAGVLGDGGELVLGLQPPGESRRLSHAVA